MTETPVDVGCPSVSVVVPLFRCEAFVNELARRVRSTLEADGCEYELLLVDDASDDRTLDAALAAAAADPAVGVLALAANVGQQRAAAAGVRRARGDWVVVMDGDLQDPPEAMPELLLSARGGFDAVFAGRRGRHQSWPRMVSSKLFKKMLQLITGMPADAGMYLVMSRELAEEIYRGHGAPVSLVAAVGLSGRPETSVPVRREERVEGPSSYTGLDRLRLGLRVIFEASRMRLGGSSSRSRGPDPEVAGVYGVLAEKTAE